MYRPMPDLWSPINLVAESNDTLPYLQDEVGIVYGSPTDAHQDIVWMMCTRVRWDQLDSSILIANCCRTWGLRDHPCVVLLGFPLQCVYYLNLRDTLGHE
jgi:hypothetical protein